MPEAISKMSRLAVILILFFILTQPSLNGQTLLSKEKIDIRTSDYWPTISRNDTLLNEYQFLDSLDFYSIRYSSGNLEINGFIIEPKTGSNLPSIIFNRGGNREFGALSIGLLIEWVARIAREGYIVIASQYRGSSGSEGTDEFGGSDVDDVLNLIPIITKMPRADTARIGMYGWSRGGMMTYLALAKTNKIKAAIIGGAPTDLLALLDQRPGMEKLFAELIPDYWANKKTALLDRSALYFTDRLCKTTSYLILHGKNDERADYHQAADIAIKLKSQNMKVESVFYDNADHILNEYRTEKDAKILSWLRHNL
jgi:dipeptidyl aminopeptidase/acylaminoacyl peptidase